jgi:Icc-related predicted phosphoesterase
MPIEKLTAGNHKKEPRMRRKPSNQSVESAFPSFERGYVGSYHSLPMPYSPSIVCLSDTHELHREVDVPSGDILIHAGDFTMFSKSAAALLDFNEWLGELPHRHKIVVPGNHEFFLEADPSKRRLLSNAVLLIDESVTVMGLKIWGSPVTPLFNGAFGRSSAEDRAKLYAAIDADTNILVTHGPPLGVLDDGCGCAGLRDTVEQLKPQLHLFGHAHGAHGMQMGEGTLFVNAALSGSSGAIEANPVVLYLPRR